MYKNREQAYLEGFIAFYKRGHFLGLIFKKSAS